MILGEAGNPAKLAHQEELELVLIVWHILPTEVPQSCLVVADHPPGGHQVVPDKALPPVLVLTPPEVLQQGEVIIGLTLMDAWFRVPMRL